MTTSRIVRGTKGRVFLYICAVLFVIGLIACYNNVRVQLDETHKSFDTCRQENDNLSTQLSVIYDYKQGLEKLLKVEKGDHQRTKHDLEAKVNEEKLKYGKIIGEEKLRFSSLQQQYSLLKTQREDLEEECKKIQKTQLDEINNLQAKLTEVQEQLKKTQSDKDASVKYVKTQYDILKEENLRLKEKLEAVKGTPQTEVKRTEISTTHFSKIVPDAEGHYVVIKEKNNPALFETIHYERDERKPDRLKGINIQAEKVPKRAEDFKDVLDLPSNLQPLQVPKVSTPKTVSVAEINVGPLKLPSVTPETIKRSPSKETKSNALPMPYNRRLPEGVVPIPEEKKNDQPEEVNPFYSVNSRYISNIIAAEQARSDGDKLGDLVDNNANEIYDVKPLDFKGRNKLHNEEDPEMDGVPLQEGEDDDAADGDNPIEHDQDLAIRN